MHERIKYEPDQSCSGDQEGLLQFLEFPKQDNCGQGYQCSGNIDQRTFGDDFGRAVANAERYQEPLALAVVDLDDFKFLNDRHGHPQGDSFLRRIAAILLDGRVDDRAYRIGGDEFALILTHADAEGATVLASRLLRKAYEAGIKVSVGFSALRFGEPADILRAEADAALYEAKRRGGSQIVGFDEIREVTTVMSNERRASVHRLIEEGRLDTVYQPIWDLNRMSLLGVEALTRPHPDYGLSGPAQAFDIAEQIGRVHQLDVLAITNALTIAPQLPDDALLFLNICPQTLDLSRRQRLAARSQRRRGTSARANRD